MTNNTELNNNKNNNKNKHASGSARNNDLFAKMKSGCPRAKNQIIEANLGLVGKVARKYITTTMPFDDIKQTGNLGLIRAVEKFKPELGYAFSTYASHWIASFIEAELAKNMSVVNVPERTRKLARKLNRRAKELSNSGVPEHEIASRISQELKIERGHVSSVLSSGAREARLSTPITDFGESGLTLQDTLESEEDLEGSVAESDQIAKLGALIDKLPKQRREAIRLYHNLEDRGCSTFEEVGVAMGVSRQRANVLYNEAIYDLRRLVQMGDQTASEMARRGRYGIQ